MRWFWLFIALLAVLTGVLYTQRVRQERAELAAMQAQAESSAPSTTTRRSRTRDRTPEPEPVTQEPETQPVPVPEPVREPEPEPVAKSESESAAPTLTEPAAEAQIEPDEQPGDEFSSNELLEMFRASAPDEAPQDDPQPEPAPIEQALAQAAAQQTEQQTTQQPDQQPADIKAPEPEAAAPPSYELRPDGSFKVIDANAWVQGAGTEDEPYVLSWGVLKSIEKLYEPRAGKDILPDWLELLDGKVVLIEGNTLVPVIATTTRELLVMQNPWDGCCIGVPPTPYDAVEVVLNHDVDFGNSAVGFGSVQGTFYLDPYVVDGWVLGIYIIEDAKYRSGEGVVFPEF